MDTEICLLDWAKMLNMKEFFGQKSVKIEIKIIPINFSTIIAIYLQVLKYINR